MALVRAEPKPSSLRHAAAGTRRTRVGGRAIAVSERRAKMSAPTAKMLWEMWQARATSPNMHDCAVTAARRWLRALCARVVAVAQ